MSWMRQWVTAFFDMGITGKGNRAEQSKQQRKPLTNHQRIRKLAMKPQLTLQALDYST